jgi:hypothetical protein
MPSDKHGNTDCVVQRKDEPWLLHHVQEYRHLQLGYQRKQYQLKLSDKRGTFAAENRYLKCRRMGKRFSAW